MPHASVTDSPVSAVPTPEMCNEQLIVNVTAAERAHRDILVDDRLLLSHYFAKPA